MSTVKVKKTVKAAKNKSAKRYMPIIIAIILIMGVAIGFAIFNQAKPQQKKLYPVSSITHGHALAVDPKDSSKVYIATHKGLLVLLNDKSLYQVGPTHDDYMGFSADQNNSNVFYSSGHPTAGGNIGFQKSEDGAFNWKKLSDGNDGPVDFHAMSVSPVDPNLIFGWFHGTLQKSVDGGINWQSTPTTVPIVALAADTKDKNVLYAASPRGMLKSTDSGKTFKQILEGFTAAIAIDPGNNQHVLAYNDTLKLAESNDGGTTWHTNDQDFKGQNPLFIAFYKANPNIAYLLTRENGLYKTQDSGKTWYEVPYTHVNEPEATDTHHDDGH